ncbi:endogenous retrovirus group 3 member 1 Env polyprotein-like [Phalacrocorax aristotelis]|uniref:endogenous retrovirus group 3 member 1 Env polyprotein-like n=1 Tax=Phalacrocorax aristotelis TaxID=126867 RepID=UPI003F4BB4CA
MLILLFWCIVWVAIPGTISYPLRDFRDEGNDIKNSFMQLAEQIASVYNLTECWICGGPFGLSSWPWVAIPLLPKLLVSKYSETKGNKTWQSSHDSPWHIKYPEKGKYCLAKTQKDGIFVGNSTSEWTYQNISITISVGEGPHEKDELVYIYAWVNEEGYQNTFSRFWSLMSNTSQGNTVGHDCSWDQEAGAYNCKYCNRIDWPRWRTTWEELCSDIPCCENSTKESLYCGVESDPFGLEPTLYFDPSPHVEHWKGPFANGSVALEGHYRICGNHAYKALPANWSGICCIGVIHPLFFLLSETDGDHLGIQIYDDLKREKQSKVIDTSLTDGSGQSWGKGVWTPQRILQYYGPATWNPNEWISGAREPIYNLNRIIRLQAILEIITNQTAEALDLLADQATQMQIAIYQHRMVLDYLLAEEGGVCGKLNDSNCYLKIYDNGKVIKQITAGIRKLAYVPTQTSKGWNGDMFSWLPGGPWIKQILFYSLCGLAMLLFLPCVTPCFIQLIQRVVTNMQFVPIVSPDGVKHI